MRRNVQADDAEWKRTILARSFAQLMAARALVERAAALKDSGVSYATDASVAKLVASGAAVSIAYSGVDVAGSEGSRSGAAAERLLRDARVFPLVEGTTEIQELILARSLLAPDSEPRLLVRPGARASSWRPGDLRAPPGGRPPRSRRIPFRWRRPPWTRTSAGCSRATASPSSILRRPLPSDRYSPARAWFSPAPPRAESPW